MSSSSSELPQPIHKHPEDIIEHVYPHPATQEADYPSKHIAELYLHDRYFSKPNDGLPPQRILVEVEKRTLPRFFDRDRWLFGGNIRDFFIGDYKKAIAVSIASLALVNGIANRDKIED